MKAYLLERAIFSSLRKFKEFGIIFLSRLRRVVFARLLHNHSSSRPFLQTSSGHSRLLINLLDTTDSNAYINASDWNQNTPLCFSAGGDAVWLSSQLLSSHCVSQDCPQKKSILRTFGNLRSNHTVKFAKGTWPNIKIRERKGPSLGVMQKCYLSSEFRGLQKLRKEHETKR